MPRWSLIRRSPVLRLEGKLKVVETDGRWGVYAGELILFEGEDLGRKVREAFQEGAEETYAAGGSPSESFELPRVRLSVEELPPGEPYQPGP